MSLKNIPAEKRTFEICLDELKKHGQSQLRFVPYKLKTKELLDNVRITSAIKWVPHELKTYELCLNAVKGGQYALLYVPKKHKTEELCITALEYHYYQAFRYLPKKFINLDFYKKAIFKIGSIIEYFPEPEKTEYFCKIAVENRPHAIRYIPEKYVTYEFCLKILEKNFDLIYWMPEKYLNMKIYEEKTIDKNLLKLESYEYVINKFENRRTNSDLTFFKNGI